MIFLSPSSLNWTYILLIALGATYMNSKLVQSPKINYNMLMRCHFCMLLYLLQHLHISSSPSSYLCNLVIIFFFFIFIFFFLLPYLPSPSLPPPSYLIFVHDRITILSRTIGLQGCVSCVVCPLFLVA